MNFWQKLKKPILVLAPMANVTDAAFRRVIAKYGKPDLMYTEFVSAEALASRGREKIIHDLWFTEAERPIVAQFFGTKPEQMKEAARLAAELGFDGIDINMGCPDKNVLKQGAGAALINNPELAKRLIEGAKEGGGGLPVSVKTRIGFNHNTLAEWLPQLLDARPAAIIIHGRTKRELSEVPAHWDAIGEAVKIRDSRPEWKDILILGNGDVQNLEDAHAKVTEYGVDGVMIGRGIFGNPWLFNAIQPTVSIPERLGVLIEHCNLFQELFHDKKNFDIMKKHFKAYVNGFDGARELRTKLMYASDLSAIKEIILGWIQNHE